MTGGGRALPVDRKEYTTTDRLLIVSAPAQSPPAPPSVGPSPSGPGWAPPPSTPPKGLSGGAKAGIAVAVVVVLVLAVLALGLVPGVSLFGSGHSANGVSSSSAGGKASGVAAAHGAGVLVLTVGVSTTYSFQFGHETGNTSCPVVDPLASNFTVPAESGSYSSGEATVWLFVYYNHSGPSESAIAVVGSTVYFLGTVTGAACVGSLSLLPLPSTYIDSTAAASAFDTDAGSFVSTHGSANAVYALVENATVGPEWIIAYTNCSYDPTTQQPTGGTSGDLLAGIVNGTTGAVYTTYLDSSFNCTGLNLTNVSLSLAIDPSLGGGPAGAASTTTLQAPVADRPTVRVTTAVPRGGTGSA